MANIIYVVGAGGKTTYCYKLANKYVSKGFKTCVLTTTKMWNDKKLYNINDLIAKKNNGNTSYDIKNDIVYDFGNISGEKRTGVFTYDFSKIKEAFDYIIIEADGSQMMPLKIPYMDKEPAIEYDKDKNIKIDVVMGMQSVGRMIGDICFRFDEFKTSEFFITNSIKSDTIVTKDLIEKMAEYYYIKPLSSRYKNAVIELVFNDIDDSNIKNECMELVLGICASGFSKRYGDKNKLLELIYDDYDKKEKPLYMVLLHKLSRVSSKLMNQYKNLNIKIAISTIYDEIENATYSSLGINTYIYHNENASDGLSSSIKLLTDKNRNSDYICFFNADMPLVPYDEIYRFILYTLCSDKCIGAMAIKNEIKNPAIFNKKYYDKLLNIDGDKGGKSIINKNLFDTYLYHTNNKYLFDIDTKDDYLRFKNI